MIEQIKVAYFGARASFTHQAAIKQFESGNNNDISPELLPHPTIDSVFTSVSKGISHFGVVPFENSTNGSVSWTLDIFGKVLSPQNTEQNGHSPPLADIANSTVVPLESVSDTNPTNVVACDEQFIPVSHCILGHKNPSSSGDKFSHITSLHTHPQAWGQCTKFLSSHPHLKASNIEHVDAASTSRAAEIAANDASGRTAAIASRVAAKEYGLEVLAEDIQDRDDNVTRFLIIKRRDSKIVYDLDKKSSSAGSSQVKSLIAFSIAHTMPGALADALSAFKPHDLNLTSINARPSGKAPWEYLFFVEVSEDKVQKQRATIASEAEQATSRVADDSKLGRALEDLNKVATTWKWLGSWASKDATNIER